MPAGSRSHRDGDSHAISLCTSYEDYMTVSTLQFWKTLLESCYLPVCSRVLANFSLTISELSQSFHKVGILGLVLSSGAEL